MIVASDTKLTVSLILNDAAFTKQLTAVNKELKLSQSEFKNASAGTTNFGTTLEGVKAKLKSVTSQLEAQSNKVELYKSEISKTEQTLDELTKSYREQESTLASLRKKYEQTCQTLGETSPEAKKLDEEIKSLEKSHTNLENKIVSTNSRLTTLQTGLNDAEAEMKELDVQVGETARSLENFNTERLREGLKATSEHLQNTSDKLGKIGKGFSEVGNILGKVALPIVGIGAAATTVSINFEAAMSNVKAISGATGKDLQSLEDKAREMGKATSKSATEAADAMGYMALAGWDVKQMQEGIEPILRLSEAGLMDLATTSDLVTDSMGGLQLTTKELNSYLDKVAQTSRTSNTTIQELMEAFINCGATTTNLGIELHEASAALGILANNGSKGYEAGTKLNSILTRMTAQSTIASGAWDRIGVSVYTADGQFRGLTTILSETKEKFAELTQEEQQYFLKQVAGTDNITEFTHLMNATGGTIEELTEKIVNSDGALYDMAATMRDNVKGQLDSLKAKLEELGLKLGEILLPMFSSLVDKVSKVVDWFDGLSDGTKEAIVKFGLLTVAGYGTAKGLSGVCNTGSTLMKVGSKLVGALSKTATATSAVGTAAAAATGTAAAGTGLAGVGAALGSAALAAAPWVAAAAAVGVAGYGIYKTMTQEVVPSVDLFADKTEIVSEAVYDMNGNLVKAAETMTVTISEGTQSAVQSYLDMDEAVRESLQSMYVNSEIINEENKNTMIQQFADMGSYIKSGWEEDMKQNESTLRTFFENSQLLTAEEQEELLRKNAEYYANKTADVQSYEAEIQGILNTASAENRALKEEEVARITELQNLMREDTVKAYSETEAEASVILGRLASYDERITAEMASKHIAEAEEMRIKAVDAATKEHDERVREIEKMRDEMGTISEEQADKMIKEAERQRDESIEKAKELKKDVVKKIEEMNADVLKDVDTQTGKIMTTWDKVKNWWNGLFFQKKTLEVETKETTTRTVKTEQAPRSILNTEPYSISQQSSESISDSLEVPNAKSYAAQTVSTIAAAKNSSDSNISDVVLVMQRNLEQAQMQNNLLLQLISLMQQQEGSVDVNLSLDGRTIAKASAKYMQTELDNLTLRKTRLGGAY